MDDVAATLEEIFRNAPSLSSIASKFSGKDVCEHIMHTLHYSSIHGTDPCLILLSASRHHKSLTDVLGREPSFIVSLLDYCTKKGLLPNTITSIDSETLRQMEKNAIIDDLTGLYNRRYIMEALSREYNRVQHTNSTMSILMADLDHFKEFNDTFGHAAGDEALHHVAALLLQGCRHMDRVARYGGEEFLIMLPDTREQKALLVAERIRSIIASQTSLSRPLTLSIGMATYQPGVSLEELLHQSDRALYRAKQNGRNRISMFDKDLRSNPRFPFKAQAKIRIPQSSTHSINAEMINISRNGACVACDNPISKGIQIEVFSPTSWDGTRKGLVVRSAPHESEQFKYQLGIHFEMRNGSNAPFDAMISSLLHNSNQMAAIC
ncbi:diguanylate cyclase [Megalodesulfovibrio paquesii]